MMVYVMHFLWTLDTLPWTYCLNRITKICTLNIKKCTIWWSVQSDSEYQLEPCLGWVCCNFCMRIWRVLLFLQEERHPRWARCVLSVIYFVRSTLRMFGWRWMSALNMCFWRRIVIPFWIFLSPNLMDDIDEDGHISDRRVTIPCECGCWLRSPFEGPKICCIFTCAFFGWFVDGPWSINMKFIFMPIVICFVCSNWIW